MAAAASTKIVKKDGSKATELEELVSKHMLELEASPALKDVLGKLTFNAAREVEVEGGKAVLVFVPFPQLNDYRRIQKSLVDELEKKLGGHVIFIANRTMVSGRTWARSGKYSGVRPRSRTLKAVQEALLEDVAYPAEIVGKRLRVRTDGGRLLRVHLNPRDMAFAEGKVSTFRTVYKALTNKDVVFEFPTVSH